MVHQPPPEWFDIGRYSASGRLDFEGWRIQICNRLFLQRLLVLKQFEAAKRSEESKRFEEWFDRLFLELEQSPFPDFGADDHTTIRSVFPLTVESAHALAAALGPLIEPPKSDANKQSADDTLREIENDSFSMRAHIVVDFNGSKQEIERDFSEWLQTALEKNRLDFPRWRESGITNAVLQSWHAHRILPYQDLLLWHRRNEIKMPSDTVLADWLFVNGEGDKDKAKATREKAAQAFTPATVRQLALASESLRTAP